MENFVIVPNVEYDMVMNIKVFGERRMPVLGELNEINMYIYFIV